MAEQTPVEKLLKIVEALDPSNREKEEQPPTDAELTEARTGLHDALKAAVEGDRPDLEAARAIRSAIDKIDAEVVTRTEQVASDKAEAAKLLEGLKAEGDEPKDDEKKDDDAKGDEAKPDDAKSDEAKADGEEKKADEPKIEAKADKELAKVASLSDAITRSAKRKAERVVEAPASTDVMVAAAGPAQGYGLAQEATLQDAAELFDRYATQVKRGSAVLIHMEKMYPDDRALGLSAEENTRLIDSLTSQRAITAAGGICEPLPADFSHPICGDRGRPIRDSLPAFRADRGGIRYAPTVTVADLEPGITVWTSETDADPGSAAKDCPRVNCEDELTASVDAIVACLTVGNFQARFNPEFWRSRLDLLMVAHDRIAEQTLYATMLADATTTLAPAFAGSGTVADLLRVIDMQVSGIRNRHRLIGTTFRTILPSEVRNAMRDHLAAQAPAGSADLIEVGDARLAQFFSSRGVTPVWSPDIELIGAQTGGAALAAYNTPFTVLTYPEGTYLFLDGGTIDLGTNITDSSLNAVNDRQAFLETFEQVAIRGCEAIATPVAIAEDCLCSGA